MSNKRAAAASQPTAAPSRAREDVLAAVLVRIRTGTPIKNAFALEGVPKRTAYDWMEADEGMRDAVDMARAEASEVRRVAFEASPSAPYLHYIQTLDPENFPPPPKQLALSGPGGAPIKQEVVVTDTVDKLSDEEVLRAARALLNGEKG